MDFLGIGPLELLMIFLIIFVILGPRDMVKAGETIGQFLRKVFTSDGWKILQNTSKQIRNLPTKLARDAGIQEFREFEREMRDQTRKLLPEDQLPFNQADSESGFGAWSNPKPETPLEKEPETPPEQEA